MKQFPPPARVKLYTDYIKKTHAWLNKLAKDEHLSLAWVYWDYFMAVVKHRCLIRQYVIGEFWKLSDPERRKRLTYHRMVKLFDKYNQAKYIHYLNEKPDFNTYFSDFVHRDWIHIGNASKDEFAAFLHKHRSVIIKPVDGVEGGGVRKFTLPASQDTDLEKTYEELRKENVLVEQVIEQHPRMVFGNTSVNTIRVHTILNSKGKAHVIKAILRAGVGNSVVDNYCQGGSIYEVDMKTGVVCTFGQSKTDDQSYIHPGTDIMMLGYKIPHWDEVLSTCEQAAERLPQIRIIGWDVAITQEGVELIEGNHNPDYELFEFLGSTGYYEKITKMIDDKKQ